MKEKKAIQHQYETIEINTDGRNHQVRATGNAAKGVTAALSVFGGFVIGYLLTRRY